MSPIDDLLRNLALSGVVSTKPVGDSSFRLGTSPLWFNKPTLGSKNRDRDRRATIGGEMSAIKPRNPTDSGRDENVLGSLYEDLINRLQSPVDVNAGELRGQIDPVYDARVEQLRNLMSMQEERVGRGREEVEDMYGALAEDYERLAPETREQAMESREQVEDLYGQLRSNIEGNYSRIADEQADMFKQLGIEAAAPEVLGSQGDRAASAMSRADELGTINQQRMMDVADIDESYYRQGAPLARLQGTNLSSQMQQGLQDFLAQQTGQIDMVEAERAAAFNQLLQQAQQQARSQENQQSQMLWQMLQSQMQAGEEVELNAQNFLGSLPSDLQQSVAGAVRSIEKSPEVVYGRVEDPRHPVPGTYVTTPDEWLLNAADQMFERGEIDGSTRNALIQYLRLRYDIL